MNDMSAVDLLMTARIDGRRVKVSSGTVTVQRVFLTEGIAKRQFKLMEKEPLHAAEALLEWKKLRGRLSRTGEPHSLV